MRRLIKKSLSLLQKDTACLNSGVGPYLPCVAHRNAVEAAFCDLCELHAPRTAHMPPIKTFLAHATGAVTGGLIC